MDINIKSPIWGRNFLIFPSASEGGRRKLAFFALLIIIGIFGGSFVFWDWMVSRAKTGGTDEISLLEKIELKEEMNQRFIELKGEMNQRFIELKGEMNQRFIEQIPIMNKNTLLAITGPYFPATEVVEEIEVIATAYSSTVCQTDSDPYITAAGTLVRKGIVANNLFPFGTEIRIPELFGNKIFVIEDRMNSRKGNYHIDVWFPSYQEAVNFGVKKTYIEILGI